MAGILGFMQWTFGVFGLICLIIVLVKMYQSGDSTLAIVFGVLTFVCGIGYLITFVYGWMKSRELELFPIMAAWSGLIGLGILTAVVRALLTAG